jgi:Ca2+-binding EF-hand superfamily protein
MFNKIDADGSGEISKEELVAAFVKNGKTAEETEAAFMKYDTDGSGSLGFEEFFKLVNRQ